MLCKKCKILYQIMCKNTTTTKQNIKHKTLPEPGINPRGLAPKADFYLCTTESAESIDCSQAI